MFLFLEFDVDVSMLVFQATRSLVKVRSVVLCLTKR